MTSKQKTIIYNPVFQLDGSRRRLRVIEHASNGLRLAARPERRRVRDGFGGWYVDSFHDETTEPAVLALPHGRYLAATSNPYESDCYIVDTEIETDLDDAWRSAAGLAEYYAESCREDEAKQAAEAQVEGLREEIAQLRRDHSAAVREIRAARALAGTAPTLCAIVRGRLAAMRAEVKRARERIAALGDNYWLSVSEG
jgi:hypothetical protein